jgi:hypothetical protein
MQAGVTFSQQEETGKSMWAKLIKALADNGQPTLSDGFGKELTSANAVEQKIPITVREITDKVFPEL